MCKNANYGDEIIVPQPTYVNIVVHERDSSANLSQKKEKQIKILQKFSDLMSVERSTSEDIIIPLSSKKGKDSIKYTFQPYEDCATLCQVRMRQAFPYDLAFAMTVHKAQGRTISRVVVDIREHPTKLSSMHYAAVFVALSRVKECSHLRLLEPYDNVDARENLYSWLNLLRPNPDIRLT